MSRLPHGVVVPVTGPPQPHEVEVHADTVRRPNPTVQKKEVRSVRGGRRPAVLSVTLSMSGCDSVVSKSEPGRSPAVVSSEPSQPGCCGRTQSAACISHVGQAVVQGHTCGVV